jgi:hypothetical protein
LVASALAPFAALAADFFTVFSPERTAFFAVFASVAMWFLR